MKILASVTVLAVLAGAASQPAAADTVYVPMGSAGEVLVIDVDSDTVVGRIAGIVDAHGLASSPGGDYLVAGMYAEITPERAALPAKPEGMSEEEHLAHHSLPATDAIADGAVSFISIIATDAKAAVRRIEVPGAVHHTAISPDGRYAVATHPNAGGVSIIDLSSFMVTAVVETGTMPNYVVVSRDSRRVYVSNAGADTVSEIDAESWVVRRRFRVGASPEHMVLSPDDATLYVANVDDGTVSAVSLSGGAPPVLYAVGGTLHGIDLSDDGRTLFVSGREFGSLVAIDLAGGTLRRVPLAPAPYHLTAIRGTGKLYVSSADEPKIWVIDQTSLRTLGEIPIGGRGHQMAVVRN